MSCGSEESWGPLFIKLRNVVSFMTIFSKENKRHSEGHGLGIYQASVSSSVKQSYSYCPVSGVSQCVQSAKHMPGIMLSSQ